MGSTSCKGLEEGEQKILYKDEAKEVMFEKGGRVAKDKIYIKSLVETNIVNEIVLDNKIETLVKDKTIPRDEKIKLITKYLTEVDNKVILDNKVKTEVADKLIIE